VKNCPGYVFKKRYGHKAVRRKRALQKRQLEVAIDALVDRLIQKHFEVTADGQLKNKRGNHGHRQIEIR
jgi:hypothetical protein